MNVNPYQPPSNGSPPRSPVAALSWHVFAFAGLSVLTLAMDACVLTGVTNGPNGLFARYAAAGVGLFWLAQQWKVLPPAQRMVGGQMRTPSAVAALHFVPFYNLYWMFTVQKRLCEGLDAGLEAAGLPRNAPTTLALLCPLVQLFGGMGMNLLSHSYGYLVPAVAQSGLWLLYMVRVARVSSQVAARWGIPG